MCLSTFERIAAIALLCTVAGAQNQKKYKDQQEYEVYSATTTHLGANNFVKALESLEAWRAKYPDSEFATERRKLFVQAYFGANQPAMALDAASSLRNISFDTPADQIRLQYPLAMAIQRVAEPAAEQCATAAEAARQLMELDKMPAGMSESDWARARTDLRAAAKSALLYISLVPVVKAMKTNDCAAAETAARKAVEEHPQSVQAAWFLGSAHVCLGRTDQSKLPLALYSLARASTLDPSAGAVDPKWQQTTVTPYLEKLYEKYHGKDEAGLKNLKQQAAASPMPPEGFTIASATQILQQKQADLESKHPEYALWLRVRAALAAENGDQYFASELKDSAVPKFIAVLITAKPECRPKELLVAIRAPEAEASPDAEIRLQLDKPLPGKPAPRSEFSFEGVPSAFTKTPFQLTMTVETTRLAGVKTSPCTIAGTRASK